VKAPTEANEQNRRVRLRTNVMILYGKRLRNWGKTESELFERRNERVCCHDSVFRPNSVTVSLGNQQHPRCYRISTDDDRQACSDLVYLIFLLRTINWIVNKMRIRRRSKNTTDSLFGARREWVSSRFVVCVTLHAMDANVRGQIQRCGR
jgi:hypothetical protein